MQNINPGTDVFLWILQIFMKAFLHNTSERLILQLTSFEECYWVINGAFRIVCFPFKKKKPQKVVLKKRCSFFPRWYWHIHRFPSFRGTAQNAGIVIFCHRSIFIFIEHVNAPAHSSMFYKRTEHLPLAAFNLGLFLCLCNINIISFLRILLL